jgi:hypothetical protein
MTRLGVERGEILRMMTARESPELPPQYAHCFIFEIRVSPMHHQKVLNVRWGVLGSGDVVVDWAIAGVLPGGMFGA